MDFKEYIDRLLEIRRKVYSLMDDLGTRYSDQPQEIERLLNIALGGDLFDVKDGKIKTIKFITVNDYRDSETWSVEYM